MQNSKRMVEESALVLSEIRKGLEVPPETDLQTSCVAYLCLLWVSLFGNADLRKGLLSSSEEVTIDHSQCRSSRSCMNCVYLVIDVGGGSSRTGSNLESVRVCCLTHSNTCSLYQQALSYGLMNFGIKLLELSFLDVFQGDGSNRAVLSETRWILVIVDALMFCNAWVWWRLSSFSWRACGHAGMTQRMLVFRPASEVAVWVPYPCRNDF